MKITNELQITAIKDFIEGDAISTRPFTKVTSDSEIDLLETDYEINGDKVYAVWSEDIWTGQGNEAEILRTENHSIEIMDTKDLALNVINQFNALVKEDQDIETLKEYADTFKEAEMYIDELTSKN